MKTVGKQLQEARLARNWTPELASRETKIKVDRVKDLEADDYAAFNNATYARGFVRTYARALGLDEYKILRQLDNKLPDDDSANIVSAEGGVAYLPETALPPRVAHRDITGLYVVLGLGRGGDAGHCVRAFPRLPGGRTGALDRIGIGRLLIGHDQYGPERHDEARAAGRFRHAAADFRTCADERGFRGVRAGCHRRQSAEGRGGRSHGAEFGSRVRATESVAGRSISPESGGYGPRLLRRRRCRSILRR